MNKFHPKYNGLCQIRQRPASRQGVNKNKRATFLVLAFFCLWGLVICRLFFLQVLSHNFYVARASGQHEVYQKLFPERGNIFIQENTSDEDLSEENLYPLAVNKKFTLVFAQPNQITDPYQTAEDLSPILEMEFADLYSILSKSDDPYEPLKHKVPDEVVAEVKALEINGINFTEENFRFYPEDNFASHVLGFVGHVDNEKQGQYGLEGYFNKQLTGQPGSLIADQDPSGSLIAVANYNSHEAQDGMDLVLTIDHTIQFTACEKLKQRIEQLGARGGSLIIMEPATGAIRAMCSFPDFNPNEYNQVESISVFKNPSVFEAYEPGSVFKVITMAAALDTGKVTPQTTYEDTGKVKIDVYTIKNSDGKANGVQTMTEVLEKSLNTGAIFAAQQAGFPIFKKYVEDFGFGEITEINLDTEVAGDVEIINKKHDIYLATASYGQGLTATPLQLLSSFGAIANNGKLMKPYIIAKKIYNNGSEEIIKPKKIQRIISSRTATLLSGMMTSVIQNGHSKRAGVPGYYVAGKTGTASIAASDKRGYSDEYNHTFIGFAPVDNPQFVMLIKLENPQGLLYAADTTSPLFGEIAQFLLNYYRVPPDY